MLKAKDMFSTELEDLVDEIVYKMQQYDDDETKIQNVKDILVNAGLMED